MCVDTPRARCGARQRGLGTGEKWKVEGLGTRVVVSGRRAGKPVMPRFVRGIYCR